MEDISFYTVLIIFLTFSLKIQTHKRLKLWNNTKKNFRGFGQKYNRASEQKLLLKIPFTSIHEYLFLLRGTAQLLGPFGKSALVYSAAAVSDYYIPSNEMWEHKIQSRNGPLDLHLEPVPKMLKPLCSQWSPTAFVVTFKLETDSSILRMKATNSLGNYGQQIVVGNLLQNHKDSVVLFFKDNQVMEITRTTEEIKEEADIEKKLICEIVKKHDQFLK